ncbi:MAG TPA: phosphate ABC transporter permease PstA, partial [Planctomycetota bacterium]|nr:phosphate ABC transporter permease PstA [Planctomycetota bacterium]
MIWLTGGALALALFMIVGLLALVVAQGVGTFWPGPLVKVQRESGDVFAGEIAATEAYRPAEQVFGGWGAEARARAEAKLAQGDGTTRRRMLRTGNFDLTGEHFRWVSDVEIVEESRPEWMLVVERQSWGRFYGTPKSFVQDGEVLASTPEGVWAAFRERHDAVRSRVEERARLETEAIGEINARTERARLAVRGAESNDGLASARAAAARQEFQDVEAGSNRDYASVRQRIDELERIDAGTHVVLTTAEGVDQQIALAAIVRAYPANRLGTLDKLGVYFSRWSEFLGDEPREANSEGGVFPAIFGTVAMTLIMTILVVPFGVLSALFLREYAKPGPLVSFVRIAINNLAGVPSIVFGVFGLGFFCYIVGGHVDQAFFAESLPNPTFGKGGLLWAALTLALLTLPVVIVPTEEALSAVPSSMREGSYACGATRWQTIRRIVLPRAMPGIMTGAILALARGAGEVAPLMLVGAVKLAPKLPIDGTAPFLHAERSFMHLGFHIFDL